MKQKRVARKQYMLIVYKNGVPVSKAKSINPDYIINKLRENK